MRTAFFIIESPMQMISAIEAKHYFNPKKSVLFIRYNNLHRNDNQIDKVLNYSRFDKIFHATIDNNKKITYLRILYIYVLLLLYHPSLLFIGDYKANSMKMIYKLFNKKKCFFLDDGMQSSYIYDMDKKANMFSYFEFPSESSASRQYIHNTFDYFKGVMRESNKVVLKDVVYFIGSPYVEKKMLTMDQFDHYLSKAFSFLKNRGYSIKYILHRAEDRSKMAKYHDVETIELNEPIELYLLHSNRVPIAVASFYSAALYTIQMLFSDYLVGNISFYLPPSAINNTNEAFQRKIEKVYRTLASVMEVNYSYLCENEGEE